MDEDNEDSLMSGVVSFSLILVILVTMFFQGRANCPTGFGLGNPYPWVFRIWAGWGGKNPGYHLGMGAMVTFNKVVSLCSVIPIAENGNVDIENGLKLISYRYKKDGSYDCHQDLTLVHVTLHRKCPSDRYDQPSPIDDWAIWHLSFFKKEGKPFELFQYRTPDEEFMNAVETTTDVTPCELPLFISHAHPSELRSPKHVHFLPLRQCETIYCPKDDPLCLRREFKSTLDNVNCVYIAHKRGEIIWEYHKPAERGSHLQGKDRPVGAVLMCDGFPMGMVGAALKPGVDPTKDFRLISSFVNAMDFIQPKPRPPGYTTPTKKITTLSTITLTEETNSSSPLINVTSETSEVSGASRQLYPRHRSTPHMVPDIEDVLPTRAVMVARATVCIEPNDILVPLCISLIKFWSEFS